MSVIFFRILFLCTSNLVLSKMHSFVAGFVQKVFRLKLIKPLVPPQYFHLLKRLFSLAATFPTSEGGTNDNARIILTCELLIKSLKI